MDNEPVGPGHNQPPSPIDEAFVRANELVATADKWRAERPVITDDEMAGTCQRLINQLRAIRDDLRELWKQANTPFDQALKANRARFHDPVALVETSLNGVVAINTDWLQRLSTKLDQERKAAEKAVEDALAEADRLARIAAESNSTAQAQLDATKAQENVQALIRKSVNIPDRARIKDDQAAKSMSLRVVWKARITDRRAALLHYQNHPDVLDSVFAAIEKTANFEARSLKDAKLAPPGIEYFTVERAV